LALENGCVLVGGTVQDYVHNIKKKKKQGNYSREYPLSYIIVYHKNTKFSSLDRNNIINNVPELSQYQPKITIIKTFIVFKKESEFPFVN
jgi:hypothetical protein